jgi:hypothetical protein
MDKLEVPKESCNTWSAVAVLTLLVVSTHPEDPDQAGRPKADETKNLEHQ